MITETKERRVRTSKKDMGNEYGSFNAVVRDGVVTKHEVLGTNALCMQEIEIYIQYLKEILEAIKQTSTIEH